LRLDIALTCDAALLLLAQPIGIDTCQRQDERVLARRARYPMIHRHGLLRVAPFGAPLEQALRSRDADSIVCETEER
jgi:hypothetical protein